MNVKELLSKMTVEEKVAQLIPAYLEELAEKNEFSPAKAKKAMGKGIGQITIPLRFLPPREGAKFANRIQNFLMTKTRLKIPAIIHDECLHGSMAQGSTIYPQSIAIASSWDPGLMYEVSRAIGLETRVRGIRQALSPTINIARDPRCGRTDETYGEDPLLTSRMAVAFIRGMQSQGVLATPKHFAGNFVGDGGRDSNAVHIHERLLREIYFPAFEAAVRDGEAWSLMAAYNSLNGEPCSASKWLLTDILRREWGFRGFVVSDYWSVEHIHYKHRTAANLAEAGARALEAGLDVELPNRKCFPHLPKLVRSGRIPIKTLNAAVERVLRAKEWLGLFENPYVDPDRAQGLSDTPQNRELALETARKSLVLLKNEGALPLRKGMKKLAVIGPSAAVARLGSYSGRGVRIVSPLDGIRAAFKGEVIFAEGCKLLTGTRRGLDEAVRAARKADAAILFVGNDAGWGPKYSEGEDNDRCDLRLPGMQEQLVEAVAEANPRTVVALVNGAPVEMTNWAGKVRAILECWYAGEEQGTAVAEALFGMSNPGGKLPITFMQKTGQLPHYYNPKPSGRRYDYNDLRGDQEMFPFGHGLSYTEFRYDGLRLGKGKKGISVSLRVKNSGRVEGDEVVQLYVSPGFSSMARPLSELKGFKRVSLKPGESVKVEFFLTRRDLSFLGRDLKPVFEPGEFEIKAGSSSRDIRLRAKIKLGA